MTTYILRTGSEVAVPAAPLVAQVQVSGREFAHRWSVRGASIDPPIIERPDRVVLPSITEPVTLRILPAETDPRFGAPSGFGAPGRFGAQSVVTVVIRHDRAAADADQVIMDEVDLSGLTHRDLIQLVPDGRQIRVIGLRTAADTPLPPVAEIARDGAREILGVPQVGAGQAIELSAHIDLSASMRPAVADGSVAAACEVLAGIGTVISPGRQLSAVAGGLTGRRLATAAADRFADQVASALAADHPSWGTGFRSATAAAPRTAETPSRTIVITSSVPADWQLPSRPMAGDGQPHDQQQDQQRQDRQLLILGSPGQPIDWPGAGGATVVDRSALIGRPPDREMIMAAVGSLLAAIRIEASGRSETSPYGREAGR